MVHSFKVWPPLKRNGKNHYGGFASASINYGHRFLVHTRIDNGITAHNQRSSDSHPTDKLRSCPEHFTDGSRTENGDPNGQTTDRYGLATDTRSAHTRTKHGLKTGCSLGTATLPRTINQRNHAIPIHPQPPPRTPRPLRGSAFGLKRYSCAIPRPGQHTSPRKSNNLNTKE